MKNELSQIKINRLYKTQPEEVFMIKSPNLTSPEVIHFVFQPEEWLKVNMLLFGLDWPILCSQPIF